jgi:hypothetical protein
MITAKARSEQEVALLNAMSLLIDRSLIWSGDFENLRPALCRLFLNAMQEPILNKDIVVLANKVINIYG